MMDEMISTLTETTESSFTVSDIVEDKPVLALVAAVCIVNTIIQAGFWCHKKYAIHKLKQELGIKPE